MSHRITGIIVTIFLSFLLVVLTAGCPAPEEPSGDNGQTDINQQDTGSGQQSGNGISQTNPDTSNPSGESSQPESSQPTDRAVEGLLDSTTEILTIETIANITGYGALVFPGADTLPNSSTHYRVNDADMYNLNMGTETSIGPVTDWFRENMEPGTTETSAQLAGGRTLSVFDYSAPDGSYNKSVTISGVPNADACNIRIVITGKIESSNEDSE